jgi:bifunctional non-homologous end joining protein LigD
MLQRTLPAGFIAPCLPTKADKLPSGSQWLHEIKHDRFRVIARKDGPRVRLYSRPGNDLTRRFPLIVETLASLRSRSCIIDGEAVACDHNGVASFNLIRYRRHDDSTFLYAFDIIELNGDDLRRDPLEGRKATLEMILAKTSSGIRFNEHMEGDGPTVFAHACTMGLEGIVSKRKDSAYRSGRSPDWLKMKNLDAPAVKREAEEDWGLRWVDHSYHAGLFGVAGVGPSPWPVRFVRHRRRLAAHGKKADMSTLRTHFTFRVDTWTPDGESIVEHVAGVEDYQVALATYRAACERWPGTPITLRQGARVIEDSRRLRVV